VKHSDSDSDGKQDGLQAQDKQEEEEVDIDTVDPMKINQFKYVIDKYMKYSDDQGQTVLNSVDAHAELLGIIISAKSNEEIQFDLFELVGENNFQLMTELMQKRDIIKQQCTSISDRLKKEKAAEGH
jgi:hypothetical protein